MNTQVSIIKLSPNPEMGDTVSIGLISYLNGHFDIRFSDKMLKKCSKLFPDNLSLIKRELQNLKDSINIKPDYLPGLFKSSENVKSSSHLEYLSTYSNGIIQFSSPTTISVNNVDDLDFILRTFLKEPYIQTTRTKELRRISKTNLKSTLYIPLSDFVHTDYHLDHSKVSNFFFDIHIDALGKNGAIIAAKSVDFQNKYETIAKHLSHFDTATSLLARRYKSELGERFVIAEEPENSSSDEYSIWEIINNENSEFIVKHPEESEYIVNHFRRKNASKFIT